MAKTTKRHRLSNMKYDEVSLVGKGANDQARILISKRDGSGDTLFGTEGVSKACRKCNGTDTDNPKRQENWKPKRHPRKPDGTFKRSSDESKRKYGKDGTTGTLPDCESCEKSVQKDGSCSCGCDGDCEGKEEKMGKLKVGKNRDLYSSDEDEKDESDASQEDEGTEEKAKSDEGEDEESEETSKSDIARDALGIALSAIEKIAGDPDNYESVMNDFNYRMDSAHTRWDTGKANLAKSNNATNLHDRLTKLVGERKGTVAKSGESEDIYKGLTPQAAEIVRKSQQVMEENEQKQWSELAKSYDYLPGDKDELAKSLRTLHETDPEQYQVVKSTLDASEYNLSQSDVFKSYGRAGGTTGAALDSADAQAQDMVEKSGGTLTHEQALVKMYEQNPEKYYKSGS